MKGPETEPLTRLADPRRKGIGGPLVFFWVLLVVFWPISSIYIVIAVLRAAPQEGASVLRVLVLKLLFAVIVAAWTALMFYAGVLLWRLDPRGPRLARLFLMIRLALIIVMPLSYGVFAATLFWQRHMLVIVMDVFWLAYFTWSRRIRMTYESA